MQTAIPAVLMRGGTSRGLFFHHDDLPADRAVRDRVLIACMGSPDARQIDGVGGGHPLTSKVAVISKSNDRNADVDYLFLQVRVDQAEVSDGQNCGNILAGVGPFAIEEQLLPASDGSTDVRIRMVNTDGLAIARVQTPAGRVRYGGDARIDGVPGTAAPVLLDFPDVAGSSCGALLPTGTPLDHIEGVAVTCIDNGMPVVLLRAADLGKTGYETPAELEADDALLRRLETIRRVAGARMNLGETGARTVPKMCLIAAPQGGGTLMTRTFIPHRVHEAIGVLGAVSVATACVVPGSVADGMARLDRSTGSRRLDIEHPSGRFTVDIEVEVNGREVEVRRAALLRTARKLMQGSVFVPRELWAGW
ncbi:MAG: 4-oxalomesaconate tautomerase [Xanthomonadales bacterium]|nr:4-oxalomesaconate tautomerase [Xanthomonadales bacterium]